MNKLEYSPELVGLDADAALLDNQVMVTKVVMQPRVVDVPKYDTKNRFRGAVKKELIIPEQFGAQSFVDEDLLVTQKAKAGHDYFINPYHGGYLLDFGLNQFFTRKANPKEFSSIHAYVTRENDVVYNHTFIEKLLWSDFMAQNNINEWRMPFSPESVSQLACSWQLLDAEGGKWECVDASLQKPNMWGIRLKHFNIANPEFIAVNLVKGDSVGYDAATHTFTYTDGCKLRLFFINTPMGQKEWSDEVEMNLDTNEITFI